MSISPAGWFFVEESGLQPLRRYCDRSVIAIGTDDTASEPTPLPCGTTRATNDEMILPDSETSYLFASGEAVLTQTATPSPLSRSSNTPFIALGTSALLLSGLQEKRSRSMNTQTVIKTRTTIRIFCLIGIGLASALWGMAVIVLSCPKSACAVTPPILITNETVLHAGDHVELRYTIANMSGQTETATTFTLPKDAGLLIKPKDVRVQAHVANLLNEKEAIIVALNNVGSGSEFRITVQATIDAKSSFTYLPLLGGKLQSNAEVTPIGFPVADESGSVNPIQIATDGFHPTPHTALRNTNGSTVYYVNASGQLRPFRNESTFLTWFNFGEIKVISESDFATLPTASPMTIRPGTVPVKLPSEPFLYAVEPNNILRHIANENEARRLYGERWNTKVIDLTLNDYRQYIVGEILKLGDYPDGMVITDGRSTCYMEWRHCRPVTEDGFRLNRLRASFVARVNEGELDEIPRGNILSIEEDRASGH